MAGLYFKIADSGPSYYDFTTFTETDPNSDITIATNQITIDAMRRDVDAGVYKDFGAGYFTGDFTFQWDFDFQSGAGTYAASSIFALTPVGALTRDDRDNFNTGFEVYISTNAANSNIITFLRDWVTNSADQTDQTHAPQVKFWYTLTRVGSTITLYIYTNSSRTTLYDTLSISNGAAPAYRYLYPMSSFSSSFSPTDQITGVVSNLIKTV